MIRVAASLALALAITASPAFGATFYVTTGLGSHETVIDADTPATWGFYADSINTSFAGGVFAMKHGPGTFGVKLELISIGAEVLASVSYADVNAYLSAGGSSEYERFVFLIDSIGYTLLPGAYYFVSLSLVGDGDPSGQSYSIRGLDGELAQSTTEDPHTIIVSQSNDEPTATPEPASALLLGMGLLGLGLQRYRMRPRMA